MKEPFAKFIEAELGPGALLITCGLPGTWKTETSEEVSRIIEEYMLEYIDGVECWHSRNDERTTGHYIEFAGRHGLIMTGGSDCHQQPILVGTLDIPGRVADQFGPGAKRKVGKFKGALA